MTIKSKAEDQFPKSLTRWNQMQDELTSLVEAEVKQTLIDQLSPHLKNRSIVFEESMGSVSFQVILRDGRTLFIVDDDYWVKKEVNEGYRVQPYRLMEWGWVQKVQQIIAGYMYLTDKTNTLIRIEMTL